MPEGKQDVETVTDDQGRFHLGLPAAGRWVVTATDPDHTFAQRSAEVNEGERAATASMYMTPLAPKTIRIDKSGGSGENSDGSMAIEVPAGALSHGIDIHLTSYSHGWNLPNDLPEASHFTYTCDLSPTEQTFEQPVTVRIRNDRGLSSRDARPRRRL